MVVLASSIHAAILSASLNSSRVGTIMGAWPGVFALAVVTMFGDLPGSELGGDPRPPVGTFTKDSQVMVPGSEGGV
jgi:hypothetical protein